MLHLTLAAAVLLAGPPAPGQQPTPAQSARTAEAYFEFLQARRLAADGEVDDALAALARAAALDPQSAEVRSEAAMLQLRRGKATEAMTAAQEALRVDETNQQAHRVIGYVLAERVEGARRSTTTTASAESTKDLAESITHLERARPTIGADLGLEFTLARLYLMGNDVDKAIPVLSKIVELEPGAVEAALLLADAQANAGRSADAIRTLEESVEDEPRFARALALLADLYERERRWKESAAAYERASTQQPRNTDLQVRWANALVNAGDTARGLDVLKKVIEREPTNGGALYQLSEAQRESGDLEAAEATARKLMAVEPRQLRGVLALVEALEAQREYQQVVALIDPLTNDKATPPRQLGMLLGHLGFAALEAHDVDKAISAFQRARALSPGDTGLDAYLAQAHLAAKQYAAAIEVVRQARSRAPDDQRLIRLEAQALRGAGQIDRGAALLEEQVRARADDPSTYSALVELYASADRLGDAERVLGQATTKFPDDQNLQFQLAAVFERQKKFGDAEKAFRDVLSKDPQNAPALNYLGYMLADRGERLDEAVRLIQQALTIDPSNGSYLDSLGWAYVKMGKLDLAEAPLRKAADQLPSNSVVQEHFGDLLGRLGRWDEAVAAWRKALGGDGETIDKKTLDRKIQDALKKIGK